ncbi:radical SAM protein [bacterium]|nr:radical SAM protein [bacterium]
MSAIFGPIKSRRLGTSLGIDLMPDNVCSLDCLYCEAGKTKIKTVERKEWVPTESVLKELKDFLISNPTELDYITFSGRGEPTLHTGLGEIIEQIKKMTNTKVAVLTNSTLMSIKDVQNSLLKADLVVPSLDSAVEKTFKKIDLPESSISVSKIIDSLVEFREIYSGEIWLEILLLKGFNDTIEEFEAFKKAVEKIKPNRVQINMLDRAPAYDIAQKASQESANLLKNILGELVDIV